MYRLGRRSKKKAKKHVWFGILALLMVPIIAGGVVLSKILKEGEIEPTSPQAITREFAADESNDSKVFDQDNFQITLPNDWMLKGHTTTPYNMYSWQATKKNADNRWLEVYVDNLPPEKAFNRLLPVSIDNNKIIVLGSVSENCTAFTGSQGLNKAPADGVDKLPAKWLGVNFTCDMVNYTRNLVGVGTASEHNLRLPLVGPKTGRHTFFFVYIDHNVNPDYQILEKALSSLTVK